MLRLQIPDEEESSYFLMEILEQHQLFYDAVTNLIPQRLFYLPDKLRML
jgi:hypothetical protein